MTHSVGLPPAQGMYDPRYEHDACGVGFIASIKGHARHDIIRRGIGILTRLTHRGAVGADPLDGDGAGITIHIPDAFYREVVTFALPPAGEYATGLVFLPRDQGARDACEEAMRQAVEASGLQFLGWRDVPTSNRGIGGKAKASEPLVRQCFVGRGSVLHARFPVMLYLARRRAENAVAQGKLNRGEYFYVCSLSHRTILYKGMLLSGQLLTYFPDLADKRAVSALALVHQRYSTNTFPTWDLAHPFRLLCHNGEINTLRGNINRVRSRQGALAYPGLERSMQDLFPIILNEHGSDTACLDNALELLVTCGYDLEHAMAIMVPEAHENNEDMPETLRDFFRYHATFQEPWDGPANLAATDGTKVVATLDRNGLRPARYWVTDEDEVIYASEAGVIDLPPAKIVRKGRLGPGRMLMVDIQRGVFEEDEVIKERLAQGRDYGRFLRQHLISWKQLPPAPTRAQRGVDDLARCQTAFGYTEEDRSFILVPMCTQGSEPIHSMGTDTPIAVLSQRPKILPWYFKQCFAQVTNPPIDPLRETLVMSLRVYLGTQRNILQPRPEACHMLEVDNPILTNVEAETLAKAEIDGLRGCQLDTTYAAGSGREGLESRLRELCAEAEARIAEGCNVLVLSDRKVSSQRSAIPPLLALAGINSHLVEIGKRSQCSLVVSSGEPREIHHFALLFAFGAAAINPWLAFDTIRSLATDGTIAAAVGNDEYDRQKDAVGYYVKQYIKSVQSGIKKVMSKMGISTLQGYLGAQIFEAVGLAQEVVDRYFRGTVSRIGGVGLSEIERESALRHDSAFGGPPPPESGLERDGEYQWRREGEYHLLNPETIALLQQSVRLNDPAIYRRYADLVDDRTAKAHFIRGMLGFQKATPIPVDQVEPVESIMRRFCTGAMSLGSISTEAHETLAIAMNRIGGKSNTGEGGEDPKRFQRDENGDWRRSHIKQVASGRFGVTPHYLVNAGELQIKICQGAKPGEGGHLPGHKVTDYIAWLRYSVPQVTLISPPPHHDIYSIEDLAQLIFDLKNVNPTADISVKLVSLSGVGTVAAGVAKGHADSVVISGYDGGTGASPAASIKHAGVPWEIGLAETHQTLVLNDLRGRIRVQVDGKLATGRDVLIATLLGAEEYGFATLPLITIGCVMMRKCHLGTCPVGIATQMQNLREKFRGKPEHVVNFFRFLAEDVRQHLANLGLRSLDEAVGRTDLLAFDAAVAHWKAKGLDYSRLLAAPQVPADRPRRCIEPQDHGIAQVMDQELIRECEPALAHGEKVVFSHAIANFHRTVGAMLSGAVAQRRGRDGLPDGTISLTFTGISGQSFGAFLAPGINLTLVGEGNDYCGKGMAGGRLMVRPDPTARFRWDENSIVGNTVLYGATGGKAFFAGRAGERFGVRNSGAEVVVEGVGDHGCEYMTGGVVVVLGKTGRNFAAGMSGGLAYVLDEDRRFGRRCNMGMVDLEEVVDAADIARIRALLAEHRLLTGSPKAKMVLDRWDEMLPRFVKVFPHEYRRVLSKQAKDVESMAKEMGHG